MALVVDTDVVSFLYKRDTRAELYRPHLNDPPFIMSFMTLAELRSWMRHRNWGPDRRQRLERYLQRYQLIYASDELCEFWAQATDSARRNGRPIGAADACYGQEKSDTLLSLHCHFFILVWTHVSKV